jgi:hypothetical protein
MSDNKPTTLVLEFGNLTNQILWTNARNLGLNVSDPLKVAHRHGWELKDNITTLFQRMRVCAGDGCLHLPLVCAEYKHDCLRNILSNDDTHWCTETIGSRFSAGLACLMGCALNECPNHEVNKTAESISVCERSCNDLFMSLNPLSPDLLNETSWLSAC